MTRAEVVRWNDLLDTLDEAADAAEAEKNRAK